MLKLQEKETIQRDTSFLTRPVLHLQSLQTETPNVIFPEGRVLLVLLPKEEVCCNMATD